MVNLEIRYAASEVLVGQLPAAGHHGKTGDLQWSSQVQKPIAIFDWVVTSENHNPQDKKKKKNALF